MRGLDRLGRLGRLLLGHAEVLAVAARCLGVLAADTGTLGVTEAAVGTHLLEVVDILAQLSCDIVRHKVLAVAVTDVAAVVHHPVGDLVSLGLPNDGDDTLEFLAGKLAGTVGGRKRRELDESRLASGRERGKGKT